MGSTRMRTAPSVTMASDPAVAVNKKRRIWPVARPVRTSCQMSHTPSTMSTSAPSTMTPLMPTSGISKRPAATAPEMAPSVFTP
jgi:hypothetical protein